MTDRATDVHAGASEALLLVAGDLDDPGAERLGALLGDAVLPGVELTLDLSGVTRLTHPALTALVAAHRRLQDVGGSLVLAQPSEPVVRALRVSGLHRVLTIRPGVPPQRLAPPASRPG